MRLRHRRKLAKRNRVKKNDLARMKRNGFVEKTYALRKNETSSQFRDRFINDSPEPIQMPQKQKGIVPF